MRELQSLRSLAAALGVHTEYEDGLCKPVTAAPETLVRVCAALGAPLSGPADAAEALRAVEADRRTGLLPPVLVAWDGHLDPLVVASPRGAHADIRLEDGGVVPLVATGDVLRLTTALPFGYHRLALDAGAERATCTVIAAPVEAYRRPGAPRSWGVGAHLAALRSARSRSVGDLRDLESVCGYVRARGGDLVTVLPLLPTFNTGDPEPSPYSPVSRLFWSELILDLGEATIATPAPATLDVRQADAEVRAVLGGHAPDAALLDPELVRYARFRGAQATLGRNWRAWPEGARAGVLEESHVDAGEERFHLTAQTMARRQLRELRERLDRDGTRLGLDLAVGVHPDGYDTWSRPGLFAAAMSVGAPPDFGFPSGQDWGFAPVLPDASRLEGHAYFAASIGLQAGLAGVLRVDHIMAWSRLYWIPHGMGLHEGTYVSYPAEELFAILTLESHRNRCEVVGENLGTVPPAIDEALPRHRIWGMYLAQFQDPDEPVITPPSVADMALIGTHDTPTFAGWIAATDVAERVRHGLLAEDAESAVREARARAAGQLAAFLDTTTLEPRAFLAALLDWLGRSASPLVVPWLEDLWLEVEGVNLPGTRSAVRPNWQRPMRRLLDDVFADPDVAALLRLLHEARIAG